MTHKQSVLSLATSRCCCCFGCVFISSTKNDWLIIAAPLRLKQIIFHHSPDVFDEARCVHHRLCRLSFLSNFYFGWASIRTLTLKYTHKKPIELKCWQVISYFIRGISCHPLVQHFVCSNFVCICGTNILLIQCCEFGCWCCFCYCFVCLLLCEANQLQWSYHFEHVCWFFSLISCHLLFMLGNFFVSFFHLFSSAFIDLRCTKNETNFKKFTEE